MIINLSPQASNKTTEISLNGNILTIDNKEYNILEKQEKNSPVLKTEEIDNILYVTILYQYDSKTATQEQKFPIPINIEAGEIIL